MRLPASALLLTALCAPAVAQVSAVRVPADTVGVGEQVEIVLGLLHDGTGRPLFPDETGGEAPPEAIGLLGDFELLARLSSGSRLFADGEQIDSVVYRATTFALDTAYAVPIVDVVTGADTLRAAGTPVPVIVRSVVPADAQDILDITPIAEFPRAWWPWLVALALLTGAWLLYRRLIRRIPEHEAEPEPVPEPEEPPLEEALRRLAALAETDVTVAGAIKPFYVELSDILRTYVARRTGVPAMELTTGEITRELRRIRGAVQLPDERVHDVDRILGAADLVKFADMHPAAESARQALRETDSAVRVADRDLSPPEPVPSGEAQ